MCKKRITDSILKETWTVEIRRVTGVCRDCYEETGAMEEIEVVQFPFSKQHAGFNFCKKHAEQISKINN